MLPQMHLMYCVMDTAKRLSVKAGALFSLCRLMRLMFHLSHTYMLVNSSIYDTIAGFNAESMSIFFCDLMDETSVSV